MQADKRIRDEIDRSIGERPHGVPVDELLTRVIVPCSDAGPFANS